MHPSIKVYYEAPELYYLKGPLVRTGSRGFIEFSYIFMLNPSFEIDKEGNTQITYEAK